MNDPVIELFAALRAPMLKLAFAWALYLMPSGGPTFAVKVFMKAIPFVSSGITVMLVCAFTFAVSRPVDGNVKVGELTTVQEAVTVSEIGSVPVAVEVKLACECRRT